MDRRATEGTLLIELGGRTVEYRFARRRRRTLGITVDAGGLRVAAPLRAPWRDIEGFLRDKESWILRKLDEWARMPRGAHLQGASGEVVPLFGVPCILDVRHGRRSVEPRDGRLILTHPKRSRPLDVLLRWLKQEALEAFRPRAAHYAAALGLGAPRVTLSNARTQWGVCTEDGAIRLCWRLVHLEPALTDYVIAHEVAHLVEMNHSRRFWTLLGQLYPGWRETRERLELAAATLPVLKGQR
ncbi:MAG TPA: SprT family zinc-dependent metalloprotease [Burkholderiales bacterium]|nr:SprT family zinc-dependent metalloprotease [Burkholderiales bacterium]